MDSDFLHPGLYRNLERIDSFDDFAKMLTLPETWKKDIQTASENIKKDEDYYKHYRNEFGHAKSKQKTINNFRSFLIFIFHESRMRFSIDDQCNTIVGGLLTLPHLAILSQSDLRLVDHNGKVILAIIMDTHEQLYRNDRFGFYHDARGLKIFAAVYGYNCPVFLITNYEWKLFVLNKKRNGIATYPCRNADDPLYDDDPVTKEIYQTLKMQNLYRYKEEIVDCTKERFDELIRFILVCMIPWKIPDNYVYVSKDWNNIQKPEKIKKNEYTVRGSFLSALNPSVYQEVWSMEYTNANRIQIN
jgi:hypothetical protein